MDSKNQTPEDGSVQEAQGVKPVEKEKSETEPTKVQSTPATTTKTPEKTGGSNVAVIIIVIVVVLVVVGVGGWFGVKYVMKKFSGKLSTFGVTQTVTPTSGQVSVATIENILMYPGSKITDQEHEQESTYKSKLILDSADPVNTIFDYYVKLAGTNKYTISRQGSYDQESYYLTLTDGVFTADIDVTKYEGYDTTEIVIKISGDSLTSGSISVSTTPSSARTVSTSTTTTSVSKSSDYVIADSNTRAITESELTSLTPWNLKVARNEIYARHGREFVHKDLQCYFAKKSWYKADSSFTESSLSTTENKNVATIQAYETKTSSPLASSDSGCNTNQ